MADEYRSEEEIRKAGDTSERILDSTYLSGGVGMGATGPRLSASALTSSDEGIQVGDDSSWRSGSIEEGDGGAATTGGGLRARIRRFFGG